MRSPDQGEADCFERVSSFRMPRNTRLSPAKKREAALVLLRRGETATKIARRNRTSEATLGRYPGRQA